MKLDKLPSIWLGITAVVYVTGLVGSLVFASNDFAIGFAAGGALVLLNSRLSARKVKKADFPHKGSVTAALLGGFYLRLILMGVCLFVLIKYLRVDPVGLVSGLSVVPAGLLLMLVLVLVANRRPEEV